MTNVCRRTCLIVTVVAAMLWTAGCGTGSHRNKSQSSANWHDYNPKASVIVMQLILDTGVLTTADLPSGTVVNGVVKDSGQFGSWYAATTSRVMLSKPTGSTVMLWDEADKVSAMLDSGGGKQARKHPQDVATKILAQDLIDAKRVEAGALAGAVDSTGTVKTGSALNNWYAVHRNDTLSSATGVTYSTEVSRMVSVIQGAVS